jgi:hypothetical protein
VSLIQLVVSIGDVVAFRSNFIDESVTIVDMIGLLKSESCTEFPASSKRIYFTVNTNTTIKTIINTILYKFIALIILFILFRILS